MKNTHLVTADLLMPSDSVVFLGSLYKVKSVITHYDRVEVVFWGTNAGNAYLYEPDTEMRILS